MINVSQVRAAVKDMEGLGILVTTHPRADGYVEVVVIASALDTYPTHVVLVRVLREHHIDFFLRGNELAA